MFRKMCLCVYLQVFGAGDGESVRTAPAASVFPSVPSVPALSITVFSKPSISSAADRVNS